jgi:hypothetical protein
MFDWVRRKWRGWVSRRAKPSISFRVSAEEKALVEFWAERNGTTVSEWLRDTVARAIPTEERRKFEVRYQIGEALDFSDQIEDSEASVPLLPRHEEEEPEPEHLHLPRNHNCGNLDDSTFPKFFSGATCYGTCDHRYQRGRPCFWPTQTAHQCDHFRPAKVPDRS